MENDKQKQRFIDDFFASFRTNHMILFVGENSDDTVLTEELCSLNWSCVVTTCKDPEFADKFLTNERQVNQPKDASEISRIPLNREKLPILRLMGITGNEYDTTEQHELGFEDDDMDSAREFLSKLPGILDGLNHMYIVGYGDTDISRKLWSPLGRILQKKIPNSNVSFFGITDKIDKSANIKRLAEEKNFEVFEEELSEIIKGAEYESDIDTPDYSPDTKEKNTFYSGEKPVTIDGDDLIRTRSFASLLTEQLIYAFRPYGKQRLNAAFARFLDDSASEGPQWYGYLPSSTFYLKRSFEDPLIYLVRHALAGNIMGKEYSYQRPIILEGDTGSGKSITLAALAYHIYNDHKNPVIFIRDSKLSFGRNSTEFNELVSLMEQINIIGQSMRILLIWDCSSHSRVRETARQLAKDLNDIGRKFVLVCSSYSNGNSGSENYIWNGKNTDMPWSKTDNDSDAVVTFADNCYIVRADSHLSDDEKKDLKNKFNEYTNIAHSSTCWSKLDDDADSSVFTYFYTLINLIRPKLELGLTKEHDTIANFVNDKLDKIKVKYIDDYQESSMMAAIKKSGIDLYEFGLTDKDINGDSENLKDDDYNLEDFNACIALFSLFKLPTPSRLALHMLYKNMDNHDIYSVRGRNIFEAIIKYIPWISYGEEENDYVFRFRTPLYSQLYLEQYCSEESQLQIIRDIIDYYINYYMQNLYIDIDFTKNLQTFLRKIGPNSEDQQLFNAADYIKSNLNLIIDDLQDMRRNNIPDKDLGFASIEVTFIREYYANVLRNKENDEENLNQGFYEERLQKMKEAVNLATNADDKLNNHIKFMSGAYYDEYGYSKRHLSKQLMQLMVELTHCNLEAEEIKKKYVNFCNEKDLQIKPEWDGDMFILPYRESFQRLEKAINQDPSNSYTYNALFKLFKAEYDRNGISENEQLKYLSEVMAIIDNIDSFSEIYGRDGKNGNNELSERVADITSLAVERNITIEGVTNRDPSMQAFVDLYDRMLEENNAAAIMLVCRQEQINAGIISQNPSEPNKITTELSDEQREICKRIKEFMEIRDNLNCIKNDAYAINMLFKITWMLYEGRPFSVKNECQLTHLNTSQWADIKVICEYYNQTNCKNPLPSMSLIHALAVLQLTGDYKKCHSILTNIAEDNFYSESRMRVPFMYCNEDGSVKKFSGSVLSTNVNTGFIDLDGVPRNFGRDVGIRFYKGSLGGEMPEKNDRLNELELGIRYTGFALYKEKGRRRRSESNV